MEDLSKLLMRLNSYRKFYSDRVELVGDKNSLPSKGFMSIKLLLQTMA